jgi:4-amino-4-deoxy-L-arabinose transferase-like glycosyltransferase
MRDRQRAKPHSGRSWALLPVIAALLFVVTVRLRVADVPLERDEGEYAYAGQLILEGVPPYELAYNMKFPGTYYAYAAMLALFGRTPWGIHVGLLLVNAATIVLVFAVGRRLAGGFAGSVAAASFAILSIDRWVLGVFAHATHFVVLAVMAGLLVLLRAIEDGRTSKFLWSGVLLGIAVLMKQHAIFFLPLGAALVVWGGGREAGRSVRVDAKRIGVMALGGLLPFAVVLSLLLAQGVLGKFWFWTFRYASAYVTEVPPSKAFANLASGFRYASTANLGLWIVGALGLVALWTTGWERRPRVALTGLLIASFVAICPGFYFRAHYFVLVLPAIALLVGVAASSLGRVLGRRFPRRAATALAAAVVAAAIGRFVTAEREVLFSMGTPQLSRTIYGKSPFVEAVEIARYIRDRTSAGDQIAVLGSEPEIYFYADRKAATGYIYTYALLEPQPFAAHMQDEMIREIETAHPRYLVFSWINDSWLAQKDSDQGIIAWGRRYVRECFDPVGDFDIVSEDETRSAWDDQVRTFVASSPNLIYTFRRKSDSPCTVPR